MSYCNLKLNYNSAIVKSTAFQNCIGKKKHTLANKTTPKLMEHKMCLTICIVTKPHLGKVCIFFTNTVYREIDTLHTPGPNETPGS